MKYYLLSLFLVVIVLSSGCSSNEESKRKVIIDDSAILVDKAELMEAYIAYNEQLLKDYDIDFRVITTGSDEEINLFSNLAFDVFQDEHSSQSGRALLLVINTKQDLVRLEVSMALEAIYTDAFISFIENKDMVRFFQDNRLAEGVFATTERMYSRARNADDGQEFMFDMKTESIGAGAKSKANIGKKELNVRSREQVLSSASDTPEDVLDKYIQSRRDYNNNPELDIFTDKTKAFFSQWTVTPVQADNEVRFFENCHGASTIYSLDDSRAVFLFPIKERACSPYFFKKENNIWKLDFASMNKVIRFNHKMLWHLIFKNEKKLDNSRYRHVLEKGLLSKNVKEEFEPYLFAFIDYKYDLNGYAYDRWGKSVFKIAFRQFKEGIYIYQLHSKGAGKLGGLEIGDKFIEVEGKSIKKGDLDYISDAMLSKQSGDSLQLKVARKINGSMTHKELNLIAP